MMMTVMVMCIAYYICMHNKLMYCCFVVFRCVLCRERLIHLLAVRPYKKPELFAKVKSGEWMTHVVE